jgi:hypothetical protein
MLTELLYDAILLLRLKLGTCGLTEIEECFEKGNGVKWTVNLDFRMTGVNVPEAVKRVNAGT